MFHEKSVWRHHLGYKRPDMGTGIKITHPVIPLLGTSEQLGRLPFKRFDDIGRLLLLEYRPQFKRILRQIEKIDKFSFLFLLK